MIVSEDDDKAANTLLVVDNHNVDDDETGDIIDLSNAIHKADTSTTSDLNTTMNDGNGSQQPANDGTLPRKRCSRLFGRDKEQLQLLEAYRLSQSATQTHPVVVIIKGSTGSGKTALANSLKEQLQIDNGSMIHWIGDRQSVLQIGSGFSVAIRQWVDDILSQSEELLAERKRRLMTLFDPFEIVTLVKYYPRLELLFDTNGAAADVHQKYRFDWTTFETLLNASCSVDFPLVFVMDDFHWADSASFDWLFDPMCTPGDGSFYIITYDSDLEDKESWWYREVQGLDAKGYAVVEISLQNSNEEATTSIVDNLLHAGNQSIELVSPWVHQQTMGNPLYVEELIYDLYAKAILTSNASVGSWILQEDAALTLSSGCTTVCEYLARRLENLSGPTLEVLKIAACIGFRFNSKLVSSAMSTNAVPYLDLAEQAGILAVHDRGHGSKLPASEKGSESVREWHFVHNSMQEAVLRVVGDQDEQEHLHLSIGRKLIVSLSSEELKDDLLTVMGQVIKGNSCIKDKERNRFAQLGLDAARKAVDLSSFESAKTSITFAVSLLHRRSWRDDYDLTLAIHDAAAEIAYACGDFENVELMVAEVLKGGRSFDDKLQANLTKVYALGSMNRTSEAIVLALDLLNQLGESFPAEPSKVQIMYAFMKTRNLLNGKSDESLLRLPTMTNIRPVSSMQIMNILFTVAFFHKPMLAPLLATRMVQLSLEYGLCAVSSVAFSVYGMLLVSKKWNVPEGTRMGNLSFKILDRFQAKAWIPRVHAAFYGFIHGWTRPNRMAFEPLLRGYRVGLETGDIEVAMINISMYLFYSFESGKPLKQLKEESQRYITSAAHKYKNSTILKMISPMLSLVRVLIGDTSEWESGPHHNKLNWAEADQITLAVIFCDYKEAVRLGRVFREFPYEGYDLALLYVLVGIANVALFKATGMRKARLRIAARRCLKKIDRVCPVATDDCLGKLTLLQAEVSSLSSHRHVKTVRKYRIAITLADSSNNLLERAVAHERYGRYLAERGDASSSQSQLRLACSSYHEWNAYRKVEALQEEINKIAIVSRSVNF